VCLRPAEVILGDSYHMALGITVYLFGRNQSRRSRSLNMSTVPLLREWYFGWMALSKHYIQLNQFIHDGVFFL